jgi:4-hydroxybenzoate polyprenyltransferase
MTYHLAAIRSVHPFPSVLVATLTVAIIPLAHRDAPVSRYLTLGLGMLFYQFALGLLNDVIDLPDDRRTKPWKPLARGLIPVRLAAVIAVGFALAALTMTVRLPNHAWAIGAAGFACGVSYDLHFKRTRFSWLPYAIALPLVPIWVYTASSVWRPMLWGTLPLGILLGFALQLANQAPDITGDGRSDFPGLLGERNARRLSVLAFAVAALGAGVLLLASSPVQAVSIALIGASGIAASPFSTRLFGRDGLFGLLAVASAGLALVFLSAV